MVLAGGLSLAFLKPVNKRKELIVAGNQVSDLVSYAKLQAQTQSTMSAILFTQEESSDEIYWSARVLKMKNDRTWVQEKKKISFPKNIEIEVINPHGVDPEIFSSFLKTSEKKDLEMNYFVLCFDSGGSLQEGDESISSIDIFSKIDPQKKPYKIIFNGSSPAHKIILP